MRTVFAWCRHDGAANLLVAAVLAWCVAACSHVPLTTMVKLSRFDLLKTAPDGLRIAVKYPDSIRIPDGGAQMRLIVTEKSSGEVQLKEEFAFTRVDTAAEKAELAGELQTGWRVEVYRLPAGRIAAFKAFQSHLTDMRKGDREKVDGSMEISVDACLLSETRPDRIVVSTFLKASELGGFVPLLKDANLQQLMAAEDMDGDAAPLGPCPEAEKGGF